MSLSNDMPIGDKNPIPQEPIFTRMVDVGRAYMKSDIHPAVASGGSVVHLIRTGAKPFHLAQYVFKAALAPATIEVIEAPTVTADGTEVGWTAKNRVVADQVAPLSTVFQDSTITAATGTVLYADMIIGTKATGGVAQAEGELILKPNTDYALIITNDAAQVSDIVVSLDGHEHDED